MSKNANRNQRRGDKHVSKVVRGEQQIMADRKIKEKFVEQRKNKPLVPMNEIQKYYFECLRDDSFPTVLAIGYPGTSKTYGPSVMAIDAYREGRINKIYVIRPAVSDSKSLGFFAGSLLEKSLNWCAPVISVFVERIGAAAVEIALDSGDIELIPMETIKGRSLENCWIIADEAEDLTVKELKKVVTRQGKNSKLVLAGDILQCDLRETSGLAKAVQMAEKYPDLGIAVVNFDRPSDIVRSEQVKRWILAFNREGI